MLSKIILTKQGELLMHNLIYKSLHTINVSKSLLFLTLILQLGSSQAQNLCFPVKGSFAAQILPPVECAVPVPGFCTRGKLSGGLHGNYQFNANQLTPASEPDVPSVVFYSGLSEVVTQRGQLTLVDAGGLNLATGKVASLLTVTGGTDYFAGAKGYLFITGASNQLEATTSGRYEGEVCISSLE